jgi:hypothetical protein
MEEFLLAVLLAVVPFFTVALPELLCAGLDATVRFATVFVLTILLVFTDLSVLLLPLLLR